MKIDGCDVTSQNITNYPTDISVVRSGKNPIKIEAEYDEKTKELLPKGHELKIGEYQIVYNSEVPEGTPVLIRVE